MTDHKFTVEEIIELLNAYVERMCGKCNVKDLGTCCGTCFITAISQAADLINRQKSEIERLQAVHADMTESLRLAAEANKDMQAEIERLNKEVDRLSQCVLYHDGIVSDLEKDVFNAKSEAIKEFAERLKYKTCCIAQCHFNYAEVEFAIDTLVKEMTEAKYESQNT